MGSPTVSVVIPTYGHGDYVRDSIASVFAQTFADHEVIVVNDGSPDNTAAVLRPLVVSGRIRYVEQPNAGQGSARNRGLADARGEFVAFLDDDDLWTSDNLQRQLDAFRKSPASVLTYGDAQTFPQAKTFDRHLQTGFRTVKGEFLVGNVFVTPGQTLIKRESIEAMGGFDTGIWGCDDWDLYLRLADTGPFTYAGHTAVKYRLHARNASRSRLRMFENAMRVYDKNRPRTRAEAEYWAEGYRLITRGLGARFAIDECCERIRAGESAAGLRGLLVVWSYSPALMVSRSINRQIFNALRQAIVVDGTR